MLKAASIILIILALISFVVGIVYATTGAFMPYHQQFVGITMEEVREFNPHLADMVAVFIRSMGTLMISVGILLTAVVYYGLRKAERWAWWATLIGFGVTDAPMVAITKPVGGLPWTLAIVTLVVFLIAIGLAAREVFKKAVGASTSNT
jgi:hypothetical protein